MKRLAILFAVVLSSLAGCSMPLYPDGRASDPEGLEAQRAAAHAIERAEEAGGSLESRDEYGATPLYRAAGTGGSYKAIQRLLAAGANIEGRSYDVGATALFAACSANINHAHGSIQPAFEVHERVRVLLEAGADPNACNSRGETALMTMMNSYGRGDRERAAMLLKYGARVDAKDRLGKTPLMHLVRHGHIAEVVLAVPQDIEARDASGRTALSWAAVDSWINEGSTFHQLLDRGAEVESTDDKGWTPLMYAFEEGHSATGIELLRRGARPDRGGWSPLMIAAWDNHVFGVRGLIEAGSSVRDKDLRCRTALHWAAKGHAYPEIFREIVDAGANVNAVDDIGQTPLHLAVRYASLPQITALLAAGANLEARDARGRTPLMAATGTHSPKYNIKTLIEHGADLNAQDDEGVSTLMMACVKDSQAMDLLISSGARLDLHDKRGRTAADHAKERYPESTRLQELLSPKPKVDSPRE